MNISLPSVVTLIFSFFLVRLYIAYRFKKTPFAKRGRWRAFLNLSFFLNIIGFSVILIIFFSRYGGTADDRGYYEWSLRYPDLVLWRIKNGSEFIYWITRPLRLYLHMDLIALHILFFDIGFMGSCNFLYILVQRLNIQEHANMMTKQVAVLTMLCFPNFLAWGRFYGKDSLMLFLLSMLALGIWRILSNVRVSLFQIFVLLVVPLYLMNIIRSHIAFAMATSAILVIIYWIFFFTKIRNLSMQSLFRFYVPMILLIIGVFFGQSTMLKLVGGRGEVNRETVEKSLVIVANMGAFGGSTTELASELNENQRVIFEPIQIAKNIFNLLFSPMPWQVRNAVDVLALFSNILLLLLFFKYGRMITLHDLYQKFLLICIIVLSFLLSFMTANIGLILRQKTMILPFIFLLFFRMPLKVKPSRTLHAN